MELVPQIWTVTAFPVRHKELKSVIMVRAIKESDKTYFFVYLHCLWGWFPASEFEEYL